MCKWASAANFPGEEEWSGSPGGTGLAFVPPRGLLRDLLAVKWHKLPAEWPPCGHKGTLFRVVAHRISSLMLSHQLKVVLARVDVRTRTDLVTLAPFTVGCD